MGRLTPQQRFVMSLPDEALVIEYINIENKVSELPRRARDMVCNRVHARIKKGHITEEGIELFRNKN